MSFSTGAALRELLDRAAIHDTILRYARGIDRKDWDLVASCFTPDAETDYDFFYQGPVDGLIAALREGLARYEVTLHTMANHLVDLDGDRASAETYAVAYHRLNAPGRPLRDIVAGVRYLDDLVRREERWLIARRTVKMDWRRVDEVIVPPAR